MCEQMSQVREKYHTLTIDDLENALKEAPQKLSKYTRDWARIAVLVTFQRALRSHPFRDSILALIPAITVAADPLPTRKEEKTHRQKQERHKQLTV